MQVLIQVKNLLPGLLPDTLIFHQDFFDIFYIQLIHFSYHRIPHLCPAFTPVILSPIPQLRATMAQSPFFMRKSSPVSRQAAFPVSDIYLKST